MRKCLILAFVLLFSGLVSAQSLLFGPFGSYKTTWLLNKNVTDFGFEQDYQLSWGYDFGMNILYVNKANKVGVEIDFMQSVFRQKYIGEVGQDYESLTEIRSFDVPVLVKFISKSLGYFEMGFMYTSLQSATYSSTDTLFTTHNMVMGELGNTTSFFNKSNLSAVIGFGGEITVVEAFMFVTIGGRFGVGLTDWGGTDGFGNNLNHTSLYDENTGIYKKYKPTRSAFGSVILGLKFRLGKKEVGPAQTE